MSIEGPYITSPEQQLSADKRKSHTKMQDSVLSQNQKDIAKAKAIINAHERNGSGQSEENKGLGQLTNAVSTKLPKNLYDPKPDSLAHIK